MDTDLKLHFLPERIQARRRSEERLAAAGDVVAEYIEIAGSRGVQPSSREIADAIVQWLRTGVRGA